MAANPYFSIIIPVYNRVAPLSRALKSIACQDFVDFEVIVIDDGSSLAYAQDIADTVDAVAIQNLQLIRNEKNINGAFARNVGIKAATGKYICLLDSDDEWTENKLSVVHAYTCQKAPQFVYHQCRLASGKLIPHDAKRPNELYTEYCFVRNKRVGAPTSTITILRDIALANLFDPALAGHQDWDFCLRLEKVGIVFDFIKQPLCIRHQSSQDSVGQSIGFEYSLNFFHQRKSSFSVRSASYFHRLTLLPKAIKELSLLHAFMRSKYFWLMFYFLKADAFKAVVNGTQKVSALNKRMRLLNQQLKD